MHYYDDGYYGGGPAYYGGPAPYYGPRGYYGGGPYYRQLVNATVKIATVKDESTGRPRPVDFLWLQGPAVNTLATALD